eukprot:13681865-Alexandrium_andersonii.AAC.1
MMRAGLLQDLGRAVFAPPPLPPDNDRKYRLHTVGSPRDVRAETGISPSHLTPGEVEYGTDANHPKPVQGTLSRFP